VCALVVLAWLAGGPRTTIAQSPAFDSIRPSSAPLPLADAIAQARRASPIRQSAAVLAEGAQAAARLSGRIPNPFVDVRAENLGAQNPLAPPADVFATVTQPIEFGSKRAARVDAALADEKVAHLALAVVERQLVLDTVRSYMAAVRARETLDTLEMHRTGLSTLIDTMARRVSEGYAAESDRLRFEAESARMDAEIARTRLDLARSVAQLTTIIGAPALILPVQLVAPAEHPTLVAASERDVADAIAKNPEVRLVRARYERAQQIAEIERLRRIPDAAVTAGYKRTAGFNTAVLGAGLIVPLFDRNGQAIARAESDVRAAAFEVAAVEARVRAETMALVIAARALADQCTRVKQTLLEPAEGVRNAARATFREGAADVLKLVDAERVYRDVRRDALAIQLDAFVAAIEARFALGQEEVP
jgi:cobalt-zinc-cadmium efflux system outer membrane protein